MKKFLIIFAMLSLCAMALVTWPSSGQNQKNKLRRNAKKIPDSYIVVLEDWAAGPKGALSAADRLASDLTSQYGGKAKHVYKDALNGFSVQMSEKEAAALSQD